MSIAVQLPYGGETHSSHDFSSTTVTDPSNGGTPGMATAITVSPGTYAITPIWPEASTFWTHYVVAQNNLPFNPASNDYHCDWLNASGTVVMRILISGETSMTFAFYTAQGSGGALTFVDSVTLPTYSGVQGPWNLFDIGLVAGSTGSLTLVIAGSLAWQHNNLNHSSFHGVAQVKHRAFGDNFGTACAAVWGQMFYAPYSTVGSVLWHFIPNANSAVGNTGWGGTVSNVNPVPTTDSTPLTTPGAGAVSTFYNTTQSVSGNILGVLGTSRMYVVPGGPPNIQIVQHVGGGNYFSGLFPGAVAYQACGYFWSQNPATGVGYIDSQIPTLEMGVASHS